MSAEPTFGRYAELPLDQMTAAQKEGYDRVVASRGEAPGPYKIFVQNPSLMHVVVPWGRTSTGVTRRCRVPSARSP
jgi:hypothetical protein